MLDSPNSVLLCVPLCLASSSKVWMTFFGGRFSTLTREVRAAELLKPALLMATIWY